MAASAADIVVVGVGDGWVVIDKPAGMLSVPGLGPGKEDCAAARVRSRFPDATGPLIVHRLDMDTSGLMVFALAPESQRRLSAEFEGRRVGKRYTALVEGLIPGDEGVIEAPIRLDAERRPFRVFDPVLGRPATTGWRVIARETDRTRVEMSPLTGRTHQLRVHAALARGAPTFGLSAPIVGDVLYGAQGRAVYEALGRGESPPDVVHGVNGVAERMMLHASALSFIDPATGRRVEFASAAPF